MILNCLKKKFPNIFKGCQKKIGAAEISLEDAGWRQFSAFQKRDFCGEITRTLNILDDDIFFVIPYSCSVVNEDFVKEPFVEIQRFSVATLNKGLQFGRQPRELQVEIDINGERYFYNSLIHEKFQIDHKFLKALKPRSDISLTDNSKASLINWITKRFTRKAFPTSFNNVAGGRIQNFRTYLDKQYSKDPYLDTLIGVYLKIDPFDEINIAEEPYELSVIFLVTELGNAKYADEFSKLKTRFEALITGVNGIVFQPKDIKIESESTITVAEYNEMHRVDDYDYISLKYNN